MPYNSKVMLTHADAKQQTSITALGPAREQEKLFSMRMLTYADVCWRMLTHAATANSKQALRLLLGPRGSNRSCAQSIEQPPDLMARWYTSVCVCAWIYHFSIRMLMYVSYAICPHTTVCVFSYYCLCSHTTMYVSWYYYICGLMLLYMCPHCTICVLIVLYMCPHTAIYVFSYHYMRPQGTNTCNAITLVYFVLTSHSNFLWNEWKIACQ
jgi:hypothetical protein